MLIDFEEVKHKLNNSKWYGTQAWYEILDIMGDCEDKSGTKGKWVTKTVKKFCTPDCWYPGTFAIEGSWNEEEGSWLEEQDGFCSECGKHNEHHYGWGHKYCPNCGAKIRGEK